MRSVQRGHLRAYELCYDFERPRYRDERIAIAPLIIIDMMQYNIMQLISLLRLMGLLTVARI